jgi:hypothetical protein
MKDAGELSPPKTNVSKLVTLLMSRLAASEGVNLAVVTSILRMAPTIELLLSHSEGMQIVAPETSVAKISVMQASKA